MAWNYYTPNGLRHIGISNHTEDLNAWHGKRRNRTLKAYCKSRHCNISETGKKEIKHYDEDETCPYCSDYLFFEKK